MFDPGDHLLRGRTNDGIHQDRPSAGCYNRGISDRWLFLLVFHLFEKTNRSEDHLAIVCTDSGRTANSHCGRIPSRVWSCDEPII